MDMQGALRARLLSQTAAGTRVYWLTRPQATDLPAITLQTISGDRPYTFEGLQGWRESRVQLDCWATTYGDARDMLEASIAALVSRVTASGIRFDTTSFEGERDGTERLATTDIYRAGIDLIVRHAPA